VVSQIPESAQPPAQPVSQTRPRLVDLAVLALLARCVFSVAAALAYYGDRAEITRQFATTYKSKNWTPDVLRHNVDTFLRSSVILALVMSVLVILLAALVRRGRNFARWAYRSLTHFLGHLF
jgi:ABC-type Fe3+ transport system permease subunit